MDLTAKSILQLSGRGKQVEPEVLGGRAGDDEGEGEELHGEVEENTEHRHLQVLPFIRKDKPVLYVCDVASLIQN